MKHSFSQFKRSLLSLAAFLLSAVTAFAQSTVTGVVRDEFGDSAKKQHIFSYLRYFSASMLATFIFSL